MKIFKSKKYIQVDKIAIHPPPLYYWQREALNSNAEVDYVIQQDEKTLPIEIKSEKKGSMQSLFLFLKEKKCKKSIRCSLENFAEYEGVDVYPLYAISNFIPRTS